MGRRSALGDTSQELDDLDDGVVRALEHGLGKEREKAPAGFAAVLPDRSPMSHMHAAFIEWMAVGTSQPVRVQQVQQEIVAALRVEQVIEREVHHRDRLLAKSQTLRPAFPYYRPSTAKTSA